MFETYKENEINVLLAPNKIMLGILIKLFILELKEIHICISHFIMIYHFTKYIEYKAFTA